MVLEVADIPVLPGREDDFVAAYRGARERLASTPGCRSVRMTRGVESPSRFVLLVEWDSVEAHVRNFRSTERFVAWRAAIEPYFASPPHVEHTTRRRLTPHSGATASIRLPSGSRRVAPNSPRR